MCAKALLARIVLMRENQEFSTRSGFGRPHLMASRVDGLGVGFYGLRDALCRNRFAAYSRSCPAPLTSVPPDYDAQLKQLRR